MLGGQLVPGDVLVHYNYQFADGATAPNKLLVMIGERNGMVMFFVVTSQEKHGRTKKLGCQILTDFVSSFFIQAKHGDFDKDSWVLLEPAQLPANELATRIAQKRAHKSFRLHNAAVNDIKACFRRSWDYSAVYEEFQ